MSPTALQFLTERDHKQLLEAARGITFHAGDVLLEAGARSQALFFIHTGTASVERYYDNRYVPVASLTDGETFGEMSLLQDSAANARVVAITTVTAALLQRDVLERLLATDEGLGLRFYKSLAVLLSRRLQEISAIVPVLLPD